jgi:predicted O-methyltransferase YrrM
MAPGAIAELQTTVHRGARVLELGSGSSTVWFARIAGQVTSLEPNPQWSRKTRERLASSGLENASVVDCDVDELPAYLSVLPSAEYDVIVIDCLERPGVTRLDCVTASQHAVRPGGSLVLDDSDRTHLHPASETLDGWTSQRFVGLKSRPLMAIETTIFRRPR